jgi:hypothetical protein
VESWLDSLTEATEAKNENVMLSEVEASLPQY